MAEAFLTTRRGFVDSITLSRYDYLDWVIEDQTKKDKLKYWLEKKSGFLLYDIEDTCFFTFSKLADESTKQYRINGSKTISAPFKNTQLISNLIATLLKEELSKHYKQHLNQNVFTIETVDLYPFHLLKAIEFNIEVFPTGHYLIHILPVSKIIGSKSPVDKPFISLLKTTNKNNSNTDEMEFSLVNGEKFYRKKFDLLDKNLTKKLDDILTGNAHFIATFDYHFLANYSPDIFGNVTENTSKNLKNAIKFINPVLDNINLPDFLKLSEEKYFKVNVLELETKNNLLVGSQSENVTIHSKTQTKFGLRLEYTRNDIAADELIAIFLKKESLIEQINQFTLPLTLKAKVEQQEGWKHPYITKLFTNPNDIYSKSNVQSACFYNGIYKPVSDWNILPIVCDNLNISIFKELVSTFNKGSSHFNILPSITIDKNAEINREQVQEIIRTQTNKTMIAVFCKYQMPRDFFEPLKNFKLQIYQGDTSDNRQNRAKLSNFVCKCLEKLGGVIAAIADTHTGESGYFIGIDLGHTTHGEEKFSNLATVIFDHRGLLIGNYIVKQIPRKENLIENHCITAFKKLAGILTKGRLQQPKYIVIHRDGKLHSTDITVLTNAIRNVWGEITIDIVEIIKSGFPVIAMKDEKGIAINPSSGSSYQDNEHQYSILVTNIQAEEYSAVISPIIIKHKFGNTDFNKIVDQVYWFTKVYTNNLYNSTRLPATTLKANNIVGTSTKQHKPTYLG
ncbi:hypothetical protein [Siphonobacter sp. SORGH_AS_1065]|uniref:hypothetical protein n=1 Tax=Siphonobacter sp. SORGH_AS_1065 TaxID=3041795 RepID=UPI002781EB92|nr:hypothetical protein [Siphonobacter sp. SORGH_AS_1065]MDQ1089457.1 hypothetical protein [Siphonobacter sp. SORGH_AS_1065]